MVWASCLLRWPTLSGVCFSLNKSTSYLKKKIRTSLVVQRLRLQASTEGSMGLIPVGELRSHKPSGTVKKKNRNKNKIILINQWAISIMF